MFGSETLEVGIGMALLFLMVSLICTAMKEWLEGIFKWRAMDLERALRSLLRDPDGKLLAELLRHPLLDSLYQGSYDPAALRSSPLTPGQQAKHVRLSKRRHLPSYIPAAQFAAALIDSVARGPVAGGNEQGDASPGQQPVSQALSASMLRQQASVLASAHLRRVVLAALDHGGEDLERARHSVEQWFNGTMDRASGWYKRRTQALLFLLGLGVAVFMNLDAVYVMQRLTADKSFRDVIVREAEAAKSPESSASAAHLDRIANAHLLLQQVELPVGWAPWTQDGTEQWATLGGVSLWPKLVPRQLCEPQGAGLAAAVAQAPGCERARGWFGADWLRVVLGWLMTALAVMLGAPFWFDVLNKFMVIRSTVKPHEKSPDEASEDRQAKEAAAPRAATRAEQGAPPAAMRPAPPPPTAAEFQPHEWRAGFSNQFDEVNA